VGLSRPCISLCVTVPGTLTIDLIEPDTPANTLPLKVAVAPCGA
jgi:hypothetical protein